MCCTNNIQDSQCHECIFRWNHVSSKISHPQSKILAPTLITITLIDRRSQTIFSCFLFNAFLLLVLTRLIRHEKISMKHTKSFTPISFWSSASSWVVTRRSLWLDNDIINSYHNHPHRLCPSHKQIFFVSLCGFLLLVFVSFWDTRQCRQKMRNLFEISFWSLTSSWVATRLSPQ